MRIRATTRLRNDAMLTARERLGLTQAQLSALSGVSLKQVQRIESLDFSTPGVTQSVDRIACALSMNPEAIVPPEVFGHRFPRLFERVEDVSGERLLASTTVKNQIEHESARVERFDLREALELAIAQMRACGFGVEGANRIRDADIISHRYGLFDGRPWTLEELAEKFGINRARVNELERRALNYLQRNRALRDAVGEDDETR